MKQKNVNEKVIDPNTSKTGKNIMLQILNTELENIESISTVYHKIDKKKRYKISIIITKEDHYEDV